MFLVDLFGTLVMISAFAIVTAAAIETVLNARTESRWKERELALREREIALREGQQTGHRPLARESSARRQGTDDPQWRRRYQVTDNFLNDLEALGQG